MMTQTKQPGQHKQQRKGGRCCKIRFRVNFFQKAQFKRYYIALVIKCILVLPSPLSSCLGEDTIYCNRDPVGGSLYVREEGVNGSGKNPRI